MTPEERGDGGAPDSARERTVLELLERALEVPDGERGAFLAAACDGDQALRARVGELLGLQSDLGPAPWAEWFDREGPGAEARLAAGARIGTYEIVRPLASGGMGRVYEARQASPRRRVALKVLRRELESEEMERRFRYESEVLARLRHPGIATVYEAGIHREDASTGPRDVPWIALEYVPDARPIDAYVADEGLDVHATLTLFLQVLEAVQHGHERGVLHRDLKPANLLVDAAGHAKLIDFGVARATGDDGRDATERTAHGELVGTLRYMSPEQAGGARDDLDVKSDVYALGVVLYELLCGRNPHDLEGLSLPAAARVVAEADPLPPRRAAPALARDLEAVLLKALETDPRRRYASATALGEDLRAFLAGRAVSARQPGPGRQLALFARRNPLVVGALALALVVLLAATFVSIRFGLREGAARREAEELQQGLLDQSFALHLDFAPQLAALEGSLAVRRSMIEEAIDSLELLESRAGDDADVQLRLALAHRSLGDVLGNPMGDNLGDLEGARRCYERTLAILAELPTDAAQLEAVFTGLRLGQLALHGGRLDEALPHFERFLTEARERADGVTDDLLRTQAGVLLNVGDAHGLRQEYEEAHALYEQALAIRRELLARHPDDPGLEVAAAIALSKVGTARWSLREPGGVAQIRDALEQVADVVERDPRTPFHRRTLADTANLLADVQIQEGRLEEAQEALDRGLVACEELRRGDPENAFYRRQWGQLTYDQGWLLREQGRRERSADAGTWRATLEASVEWLARSRDAWTAMGAEGQLQPRELGNVERIGGEIDELLDELLSE